MNKYILTATILSAAIMPANVHAVAATKEEAKMLKGAAECAYVVQVAEENGVPLKNSSATWNGLLSQASQKLGVDTTQYIQEAREKYNSRARKMGADDTLRKMISNAQACDKGL